MTVKLLRPAAVIVYFLVCAALLYAPPFRVRVNGKWTVTLDDKDIGAPGSGFTTPYDSTESQVTITIQNSLTTWTLYVRKSDTNWTSGLPLYVRRTGTGATSFQQVTDSDVIFFTGTGGESNIPVQLRLDLDLQYLTVDNYVTTIIYTAVED